MTLYTHFNIWYKTYSAVFIFRFEKPSHIVLVALLARLDELAYIAAIYLFTTQ